MNTLSRKTLLLAILASGIALAPCANAQNFTYRVSAAGVKSVLKAPVLGALVLPAGVAGTGPFTLTPPTSDSPGSFSYTSSNPAVAAISGTTLSIVGNGQATITASQEPSGNFLAGSVSAQLAVGPSLVGNGSSKAGACASGKSGCVVLSRADLPSGLTLSAAFGTADLLMSGADGTGGMMRSTSPGLTSGKWYFETTYSSFTSYATFNGTGIYPANKALANYMSMGGISFEMHSPNKNDVPIQIMNQTTDNRFLWVNPPSPKPAAGQVVGVALDMDNRQITFYAPIGVKGPYPIPAGSWKPAIFNRSGSLMLNFGQGNFTYAVPAGFNAGVW